MTSHKDRTVEFIRDGDKDGEMPVYTRKARAAAMAADEFYVNGDVLDVLEECDQLAIGLGVLRRRGRIRDADWTRATKSLEEIQAIVKTGCRR